MESQPQAPDTGVALATPAGDAPISLAGRSRPGERVVLGVLALCAAISILTTVGIVVVLFFDAAAFFGDVSIVKFFTDTAWRPFGSAASGRFGVLPLLNGTLLVTAIAMIVAVPLGLGSAVYLSEYAPQRARRGL